MITELGLVKILFSLKNNNKLTKLYAENNNF